MAGSKERTRVYRERQSRGAKVVPIEIDENLEAVLKGGGFLTADTDDPKALRAAIERMHARLNPVMFKVLP